MKSEAVYMLSVVAAVFAANYALRALPFLLFGGRGRELPRWASSLGAFVSPVIIAALIVYSYAGLQWRTAWPYIAGAVTVALQLWRRNPLTSIVAGTVLYMCLLSSGCVSVPSDRLESSVAHPIVRVTSMGIRFKDRPVTPEEAVKLLEKNGVPKDRTLHVLVDDDFDNQRVLWVFKHNYLDRAGYTKSVWIHARRGESGKSDLMPPEGGVSIPYRDRLLR
jgi:branched-subunit amino acid transport protein AzlD